MYREIERERQREEKKNTYKKVCVFGLAFSCPVFSRFWDLIPLLTHCLRNAKLTKSRAHKLTLLISLENFLFVCIKASFLPPNKAVC
uniref:Uncharacterized protein n=1 Tax=Rhizophora mucronata TaxID=61149 RepID=A0A2P2KBD5_RHIMU